MHPILFTAFGVELRSYPFFLALAAAIGILGCIWYSNKRGFAVRPVIVVLAAASVAVLVGARLMNAALNWGFYSAHPEEIWTLTTVGFSLYGGILLAALVGVAACRALKIDVWKLGDTFAPFIGLSIAIVRIGCFLNGCCFGTETDLPWGVTFPFLSPAHRYQMSHGISGLFSVAPVHPTELYELAAAFVGAALAMIVVKRRPFDGAAILAFAMWFTAFRFFDDFLRVPSESFRAPAYFYPILYLVVFVATGCIFRRRWIHSVRRDSRPTPPVK